MSIKKRLNNKRGCRREEILPSDCHGKRPATGNDVGYLIVIDKIISTKWKIIFGKGRKRKSRSGLAITVILLCT